MNAFSIKLNSKTLNRVIKSIGKVNFLILVGIFCIISYIEVMHYKIVASYWVSFAKSNSLSVKILFVSDPQLLGLNDEHWLFGPLTRWDCDRFLAKGFREAVRHVQPNVVIFMGDIFDEGTSSTDFQFESYVKRFNKIFQLPKSIKRIVIPGDNDIAREGFNYIETKKLLRFKKFFTSFSYPVESVLFLDILKFHDYMERIDNVLINVLEILEASHGKFRIFCNHFGILNYLPKLYPVMAKIRPNLIMAGHEHESSFLKCISCFNKKRKLFHNAFVQDGAFLSWNISQDIESRINQIVVPTCNYRMGFQNMGFGFMELDYSGQMNYTVLWLPDRYNMLTMYLYFASLSLVILALEVLSRYLYPHFCVVSIFQKCSHLLKRKNIF